jgi:lysyl-tRNA synthetase, class II
MPTEKNNMDNELNPSDEYQIRLKKIGDIKEQNLNPYPDTTLRNFLISQILADFDNLTAKKDLTVAGRIMSLRLHGGSCFGNLADESGQIQFYLKQDEIGKKEYDFFVNMFDVGDIIELTGGLFTTKKGEKTLLINKYNLLSKSLLPLPAKWHGLQDVEIRYRKRYLDLIANPEIKQIFIKRSKIIQFIRNYLGQQGFIEVETPILQPLAGGAAAKPFITHHNALNTDLFLRIAPELYLKRLIVGGMEKVFEIARCFRNEGIDFSHNPEFTQVEFYWAYKD